MERHQRRGDLSELSDLSDLSERKRLQRSSFGVSRWSLVVGRSICSMRFARSKVQSLHGSIGDFSEESDFNKKSV